MSAAGRAAAGERTRPPRYLHSARGSRYEARQGQTPVGERPGVLLQVVLFLLAAGLAAFTIVQGIAPHDEGLMLQAGGRIASGEWPYRDFWTNYPPGQPLVLAVLQEIFGASLLAWRVVAVAVDAGVALLAYRLAQRRAPEVYALGAWLAVASVMAFPMLPGPDPPALLLSFAALMAARRRPGLAGAVAGLAVLFRFELGLAAIAGVLLTAPRGRRARALGPAVAVAVVSLAPFALVAPHAMWHDTIGFYAIQDLQRLPFPIGFHGPWRPSKLIEFYIPLILVAGLALWCVQMAVGRERRPVNARASMHGGIAAGPPAPGPDPEAWSLAPLALVGLGYLLGRTDVYHLVPLAAVLPVMLTWTAAVSRLPWLKAALLTGLVLIAVYGVERRAGQALHPPAGAAVPGPAGDGVQTSPADARALSALESELARVISPGEPIFVTDPRTDKVTAGDPLLYVITGHPDATRYDVMQPGVVTTAPVQSEIVGSLRRAHTRVVVRWLDPRAEQAEPDGSSRSSGVHILDDYLKTHYRPLARYGVYQVLLARGAGATVSDRLPFPRAELRRRTLRGTMVTAGFLAAIDGLVLVQGLVVTRLLGPREIGLYGVVSTTVISIIALKRVGIDELFVAQEEADQEREFQFAFTLELALAAVMCLIILALSPVIAAVYRDHQLLALMASLAYLPIAFALQAPLWVFFRRMDYRRQRSLQAIQPIVGFVVTVPLAAATSLGVWSLVIGQVAGYVVAIAATLRVTPYRLALRFDRRVAARYLRFSGPIMATIACTLIIAQGQILMIKLHDGLAAAGFITLAVTLTRYIDRADQIVTATIYPAICAIQGQRRALEEMYLKSNRATLLWVLPYAVGVVLFAPDLVHFVLGDAWAPSVMLLQGLAIVGAITQLGFNWFSFFRAHGQTRPPAVEAIAGAVAFLVLVPAGLLLDGFHGFVLARIAAALVPFAVRGVFVRRLLPDVRYRQIVAPTLIPIVVATAAALAVRAVLWGHHRTLGQAIAEAVLFTTAYTVIALRRERALVAELLGAVRGGRGGAPGPGSMPVGNDDVLETATLEARPGPVGEGVP